MDLAPDGRKAATFGLYYLIRDIIVSIAAFGGALLWEPSTAEIIVNTIGYGKTILPYFESISSPATNFLVAFGFGIAGTFYFALFGRDLGITDTPTTTSQAEKE
jgi:hypothetical protein